MDLGQILSVPAPLYFEEEIRRGNWGVMQQRRGVIANLIGSSVGEGRQHEGHPQSNTETVSLVYQEL